VSRGPQAFKQRDMTRILRAAAKAGVPVRIEFDPLTGKIAAVTSSDSASGQAITETNLFDLAAEKLRRK
jgi:hypothetical protein